MESNPQDGHPAQFNVDEERCGDQSAINEIMDAVTDEIDPDQRFDWVMVVSVAFFGVVMMAVIAIPAHPCFEEKEEECGAQHDASGLQAR